MKAAPHNFARPGKLAGEQEQRLAAWMKVVAALAPRKWAKVLAFALNMEAGPFTTTRPADALEQLPESVVAYRLALSHNNRDETTLLIMPRVLGLMVVAGLMGDVAGGLSLDREFTVVEESLFRYFLQDYLLPRLQETWPGAEPLKPRLEKMEPNPRWTRALVDAGILVASAFTLQGPSGEHACQWLVPQKCLLALLGESAPEQDAPKPKLAVGATAIEALVRQLPVEIEVHLGTADLSLAQLARLTIGDMVVLNQKVSEPIAASMKGGPQFRGWAGRVGAMQAFQIESLTTVRGA